MHAILLHRTDNGKATETVFRIDLFFKHARVTVKRISYFFKNTPMKFLNYGMAATLPYGELGTRSHRILLDDQR